MKKSGILRFGIALALGLALSAPARAQITDIDGDGIAVTFLDSPELACAAGGQTAQVRVRIEFDSESPSTDGPPGVFMPRFTLIDSQGALLLEAEVPFATSVDVFNPPPGPGPGASPRRGVFTWVFPLACSASCGVEGRFDLVGEDSTFQPIPASAPPGPPVNLGQIGGGGGPLGEGLDIVNVGASGACVELAIEGQPEGGSSGDPSLCCGAGPMPATRWQGLVALAAALAALATFVLVRRLRTS